MAGWDLHVLDQRPQPDADSAEPAAAAGAAAASASSWKLLVLEPREARFALSAHARECGSHPAVSGYDEMRLRLRYSAPTPEQLTVGESARRAEPPARVLCAYCQDSFWHHVVDERDAALLKQEQQERAAAVARAAKGSKHYVVRTVSAAAPEPAASAPPATLVHARL
jgi:hypothetical protein